MQIFINTNPPSTFFNRQVQTSTLEITAERNQKTSLKTQWLPMSNVCCALFPFLILLLLKKEKLDERNAGRLNKMLWQFSVPVSMFCKKNLRAIWILKPFGFHAKQFQHRGSFSQRFFSAFSLLIFHFWISSGKLGRSLILGMFYFLLLSFIHVIKRISVIEKGYTEYSVVNKKKNCSVHSGWLLMHLF